MMLTLVREYVKDGGIYGSWLWNGEKIGISMENASDAIGPAVYGLEWYNSPKFGRKVPILFNDAKGVVLGPKKEDWQRDFIEIHPANRPTELGGCLSGGVNKTADGVYPSRPVINWIYRLIEENELVNLEVVEHENFSMGGA